jgi:hypothetical protein
MSMQVVDRDDADRDGRRVGSGRWTEQQGGNEEEGGPHHDSGSEINASALIQSLDCLSFPDEFACLARGFARATA